MDLIGERLRDKEQKGGRNNEIDWGCNKHSQQYTDGLNF